MRRRTSGKEPPTVAMRWQAYAVAALVLLAILFGGGGAEGPVNNGFIQAFSAVLLSLLFASHFRGTWPLPKAAEGAGWLLLALVLIMLLQLIPLPPSLWQSLPGRELAASSLSLTGSTTDWRPISLDPEATRRVVATLLLPSTILYGLLGATRREALLVIRAAVLAAGASALVGALQLTLDAPSWLIFYEGPNPGAASGVFANPNHHASLLLAAILLLAFLIRVERSRESPATAVGTRLASLHPAWLAVPFFVVMTLVTGSRAGMVLLALAIPGALWIALGRRSPLLWLSGLAVIGLFVLVVVLTIPSGNVLAASHSFIFSEDGRYAFLPDVLYTLDQYWPWGSGLGTFVPVFAPNENLDVAGAGYVNHAHNDLLEWLIETGIVGAAWLVFAAGILLWRVGRVALGRVQLSSTQSAGVTAGALILTLLALHSLIDYPLRIAAVAAVAAIAAGLMFSPLRDAPPGPVSVNRGRWPLLIGSLAGILLGAQVLRIFVAEAAVREGNGALAQTLRPQSGRALALAAEQQLAMRNEPAARQLAVAALQRAPLSSAAVRVLAMTNSASAAEAWRVASAMGWRDGLTQLWAFRQALTNGEFEVAAIRADAFLRTRGRIPDEFLTAVRTSALEPQFRSALIGRLTLEPPWRARLFAGPFRGPDEEIEGLYELLVALAASGHEPALGEARGVISTLIARSDYAKAIELYQQVRGRRFSSTQLLDDGGFDRPAEDYFSNTTLFDWLLTRTAGATATLDEQDGFLLIETDGSADRTPVRRYVPLAAGSYRLDYLRSGDADSPEAIRISIRCAGGDVVGTSSVEPLRRSSFARRRIQFQVGPNCPMILIELQAKAIGRPASAEFDQFSLRRISE